MKSKAIRLAREEDAAEILEIYRPYVTDTAITFECKLPSADEFRSRIREVSRDYPYLVCTSNGKIIGYAYAHRHMTREAYQWSADLSVYLDRAYFRCGVGRTLYNALIEILKMQNIRNVYGCVTSPNVSSEKLHEALGFKKMGVYHSAGYKCGAWHDVSWFERAIGEYDSPPEPFKPIQQIDKEAIRAILGRHGDLLN